MKLSIHKICFLALPLSFFLAAYFLSPLSQQGTLHPENSHCGVMTYTASAYPLRTFLTEAHQDDLEIRNQLCWVRKMIVRTPEKFDEDELDSYLKLLEKKLFLPEIKYRVTLPLLALLYGKLAFQVEASDNHWKSGNAFFHSLHFWKDHYTYEVSSKNYPWWNWPHSDYIQFEYGLVERHWPQIIESIEFSVR